MYNNTTSVNNQYNANSLCDTVFVIIMILCLMLLYIIMRAIKQKKNLCIPS